MTDTTTTTTTDATTPTVTVIPFHDGSGLVTVTMNERAAAMLTAMIDRQHATEKEAQRKADELSGNIVEAPRMPWPKREVLLNGTVITRGAGA
jgi:hypothetical protein